MKKILMSLYPNSRLVVKDNSDAKVVKLIKKYKSNGKTPAFAGDKIIVSIRKRVHTKVLLKDMLYRAVILTDKVKKRRFSGLFVKFFSNACVILNQDDTPVGNVVFGISSLESSLVKLNPKADKSKILPAWWRQV